MTHAARSGIATLVTAAIAACAPDSRDAAAPPSQSVLADEPVLSYADYRAKDAYLSADLDRGGRLALQCRACHSLDRNGASIVGPNLHGIFGRAAGSVAGFAYSDALASADFTWTPSALDAWLENPFTFLPGNRMTFPGLADQADRNALIAYLLMHTDGSAASSHE